MGALSSLLSFSFSLKSFLDLATPPATALRTLLLVSSRSVWQPVNLCLLPPPLWGAGVPGPWDARTSPPAPRVSSVTSSTSLTLPSASLLFVWTHFCVCWVLHSPFLPRLRLAVGSSFPEGSSACLQPSQSDVAPSVCALHVVLTAASQHMVLAWQALLCSRSWLAVLWPFPCAPRRQLARPQGPLALFSRVCGSAWKLS